ncbi:hypothetical protein BBJ28_00008933 [Nothophytophthora sp. Chile5]|nr:hypothetical protein BBJ28_00008933 [Nothophytophthora sp. Chile5]
MCPRTETKEEKAAAARKEDDVSVNNVVKLRLLPTTDQRKKLELMFAANRAVYNKLVACSREDRLGTSIKKMSQRSLMMKYRPIAVLKSMSKYFRNSKRARARHKLVHDEVRDSAFRDFKKAVKSSLALFFAKKKRDEKTTYPDMKFKSKIALSNTIEIRARSIKTVQRNGQDQIRFHQTFFGLKPDEGIALHEPLPVLTMSVRLQRLREGEYYVIVPHLREFSQTKSERVCAIDPGVRKFVTVYDPAGRTFGVKDAHRILKKKFEAVDTMKSILQLKQNACKEMHCVNIRSKHKHGSGSPKSSEHRLRYRLRQRIRHTSRKATRVVNDMHQKLSSYWLQTTLAFSFRLSRRLKWYADTSWR